MNLRSVFLIIILLLIGGGAYYYFTYGPGATKTSVPVATSTPTTPTPVTSSSGGGDTSPEGACEAQGGTFNPEVNECVLPLIVVSAPAADALVSSPLTVSGKARGYWYFEASFPLEVTDSSGKVLAQSHAEAQGDWMTEEYVPFKGTLTFTKPNMGDGKGFIIFRKDNPSGLPENEASVSIPIRFR